MKAKLILKHRGDHDYFLVSRTDNSEALVASLNPDEEIFEQKLSIQNCDELFGIIDVEKWAKEYVDVDPDLEIGTSEYHNAQVDFKAGFNKAMELNKDKVFTVEEMKKGMSFAKDFINWEIKDEEMIAKYGFSCSKLTANNSGDAFIQSLQQPNEIEVEIVMEEADVIRLKNRRGGLTYMASYKLDSRGCLILKNKKQ